jgi:phosphatidylserine/phosphatidylglycerophosphate/cardiolipin synthase-like enzyme
MGDGNRRMAEEACRLARLLPSSVIEAVAARLGRDDGSGMETLKARVARSVSGPHHRALVAAFFDLWSGEAPGVPPCAVAVALLAASESEKDHREGQSIELVWTGPEVGVVPRRRTEQVILQVIDSSCEHLLVVSYAVFNIPRICEAIIRAADRGVALTIVVESPDRNEGKKAYSTLSALGPAVASRRDVYVWPIENRSRANSGKPGLLHVKCVVADGRWLFLSSANLTEYAFTTNMELGVLITGGEQPARIEAHFRQMISDGTLARVNPEDGEARSVGLAIQGEGPK